jgi:putative ABC transport system substrate-binding protein
MPAQTPTWEQQSGLALKDLEATARSLQVKLQELRVKVGPTEIDLDGAFKIAAREQLGAIILMPWARFGEEQKRIADLAIARRLPTISGQGYTESGILMSYGANSLDLYRRAAVFVDKILKGAKPADLPVEQPTKFEFVINLKTAKQIGLTIPPNVLARADRVIR